MFDFTSSFWSWWIIVLSVGGILGCGVLTYWMTAGGLKPGDKAETMGHVWDDDLAELNNPLPRWWLGLFYAMIVLGLVYLVLYPGLGAFKGLLGWTNVGQYEEEMQVAEERYGPLFEGYLAQDLVALAENSEAMKTGGRLFATYCSVCHGSDARGAVGFPNLVDNDWLYGGDPETIKHSIVHGRQGNMPGWEAVLGKEGVYNVVEYVRGMSGRDVNEDRARAGQVKFQQFCTSCHGADGKGNQAMGAPDLTDDVWLYGGSHEALLTSVNEGRRGEMPAHGEFPGEAKAHLLSAYVYHLSRREQERESGQVSRVEEAENENKGS
jgi:cytochrome c oxidase cbb3-type subunit 3